MERILHPPKRNWMRYFTSIMLFLLLTGFCSIIKAQKVTITTDLDDYFPGQWVIITGTGWQNNDSVYLTLTHLDPMPVPLHTHDPWYVKPDSSGYLYYEWFVGEQELGTSLELDALGVPTGYTASTFFTDALRTDTRPSAFVTFTGGNTYCLNSAASPLTITWNTTTCDGTQNGGNTNIPISITWFKNTVNTTSGGTLVQTTNTNAGTTSSTYTPLTNAPGTLFYYVVISWSAGPNCAVAGNIISTTQTIIVTAPPSQFSVTGGGSFCSGGIGVPVGLSNSVTGVNYQLKNGASNVGSPVAGTGLALDLGNQTASGTYTVVAGTGNCTTTMLGNAVVNALPLPPVPTGAGAARCGTGTVTITASDGAGTTIDWYANPSGGIPLGTGTSFTTPSISSTTIYYAETRNLTTQCLSATRTAVTATVNPIPATPSISADFTSTCQGGSVPLTSSSSSGNQWYKDAVLMSGQTSQILNAVASGSYTVVVTTSGCPSAPSAPVSVTVFPRPTGVISGTQAICAGGTAQISLALTGTGPWSGVLSNGQSFSGNTNPINVNVSPTSNTTYTITSLADSYCQAIGTDLTGSAVITVKAVLTATMSINGNNPVCYGLTSSVKFNGPANSIVKYNIDGGSALTGTLNNGGNLVVTTAALTSAVTYNLVSVSYPTSPSCENFLSGSVTITIETTPPVWTTTAGSLDRTLECSDVSGLAAAEALIPVATDNCPGTLVPVKTTGSFVAGSLCPQAGSYTNTWYVLDAAGNTSSTFTQTITIVDNTAPSFTRPADKTIYTDASCNYDITVANTGDVTDEADNCSTGLQANYSDQVANGACQGSKIITRTWSLVDNCGNPAPNQVQTITVLDNIAPTFTRPADKTIYTDASCNYNITVANTGDVTNEADNCSTGLQATYSDQVTDGSCLGSKIITRTWSLVDNCGNPATDQVQTITVLDNIAPTFTRPADKTIYTDASCNYDISVANTGDVTNEADNCSTGMEATYSDQVANGACQGSKIITRTWSLVDNCGNPAPNQVQIITVLDNIAPTFTRPADKTIYTDASCNYNITVANTGDVTNEADNCSTGLQATYSDQVTDGSCLGSKIITRTWSLTDDCGNPAPNQIQTITVLDNTAPVITVPANIVVNFNPSVCGATVTYTVSANDNCSGTVTPVRTAGLASGSVFAIGTTTVTHSATDACGNTSYKSFTVTVLPLAVTPVLTVSPVSQQYSDMVQFKVVILNGASEGCSNAATSATFTVSNGGSQVMGTANFVINGTSIEAILNAPLLGASVMAPGNKTVSVVLNGVNNTTFTVGNPNTTPLTITQEDARVIFTGTSIVATASATSGLATVTLRSTVLDITAVDAISDPNAGDIRYSKVRFLNGTTPITGTGTDANGWMVPTLVNSFDLKTGVVSLDWPVNIGTATDVEYTIGIEVSNYYVRNNSMDNTIVTVYKPTGDFITGGGYIIPPKTSKPAGTYSADPNLGLRTNFGFNVKYNKNGTNLQGNMNFIIRAMSGSTVRTYQIKANAMTSLGVDVSNQSAMKAVFVSKANLTDITNPLNPVSLGGNLKLQVNLTDKGEPGSSDQIAVSLWDGSTLLYSSNWSGSTTTEITLGGGNLLVHSGYSLNASLVSSSTAMLREIELGVKAYPNPFTDHITFDLQLKTDSKVRLEIYNIIGTRLATLFDDVVVAYNRYQLEYKPENVSSGVLIYRLIIDDQIAFTGKLIHK